VAARKILIIVPEDRWDGTLAKAQDEQFLFIPQREDFERHEPLQLIVKGPGDVQHVFEAEVLRVVPGKGAACLLLGGLEALGDAEPVVERSLEPEALVVRPAPAVPEPGPDLLDVSGAVPVCEPGPLPQDLLGQSSPDLPDSGFLDQFQDEPSPAPGSSGLASPARASSVGVEPAPSLWTGDEAEAPLWSDEPVALGDLEGEALTLGDALDSAPPEPAPVAPVQELAPGPPPPDRGRSGEASEERSTIFERIKDMTVVEKQRLARSASKTERTILVRDPLKQVHLFVLKNPRVRQDEVLEYAKYGGLAPQALKYIADNKTWMQSHQLRLNLVKNPNIPMESARLIMGQLQHMDLRKLMKSGAVRPDIRSLARKEAQKKGLIS
jgi:hypothetical protein